MFHNKNSQKLTRLAKVYSQYYQVQVLVDMCTLLRTMEDTSNLDHTYKQKRSSSVLSLYNPFLFIEVLLHSYRLANCLRPPSFHDQIFVNLLRHLALFNFDCAHNFEVQSTIKFF